MAENILSPDSIASRAASMAGLPTPGIPVALLRPQFTADFKSEAFPEYNGTVVLRYPNVRDNLQISALTLQEGNSFFAQAVATVRVCVEKAPSSWYRSPRPEEGLIPVLDLDSVLDATAIADLYGRFLGWRDSFRRERAAANTQPGADSAGDPTLASKPSA
jgi:hypothetical protein